MSKKSDGLNGKCWWCKKILAQPRQNPDGYCSEICKKKEWVYLKLQYKPYKATGA